MTNQPPEVNEKVLLESWALLSVYDKSASHLKNTFVQRRFLVISLTLIATVTSVLTGITGNFLVAGIFGILSIALPIISSYIMNDIIKFTGTTTWIRYRYIAETMRMHIYLYRMHAGKYREVDWHTADDLLTENIAAVRNEIKQDEVIPFNVSPPKDRADIEAAIKEANSSTPDDNGLAVIEFDDYLQWRVVNQRKWYDSRVIQDFTRLKRNLRLSQVFLLAGALIGAFAGTIDVRVIALVAATNAISVALTSWSNVSMFGKTYSLFLITSLELRDRLTVWYARENNPDMQTPDARREAQAQFAKEVEETLERERNAWYELAIQVQTTSDQTILSSLEKLTQRRP